MGKVLNFLEKVIKFLLDNLVCKNLIFIMFG